MEFGRFWGGPDLFMRLFVNKTMVPVDQLINHIHVFMFPPGPQVWFFSGFMFLISLAPFWHLGEKAQLHIRTDRMSIHHCSGVTSISTGIYRAEFRVGVCWTPDSGNSWTSRWDSLLQNHCKQLTSFISHSCIRHEVCANHVGRLYDVRAWVLMGSRSAVTLGMWKSTWRCESQPGDVETWDPRAFHSFHILPSVIWRIKAVTVLLHSFTRLAWWLWDHHAKCPWCWSGAWWSHQPSSNKGNGVDHPIYGFTWIHGLFFSPPGIFHVYFGGFLCGKTTALLGWHETYGVPFGQNEGWRSGTVKHYSAEINIESLEWLLLLYHLHSLIVDSVDYIG